MPYPPSQSPYQKAVIGPSSSDGLLIKVGNGQLLAIYNASKTAQAAAISIYDAPSVSAAVGGSYPPLYQPTLDAGRILDLTILERSFKFDNGIVVIPSAAANADGGWMFLYL